MAGHSKWSTIKRKKAATDAKRAKIFTQMARAITVAAQSGGGDPDGNFMLRVAIDQARAVNMPKENIERAIKRGTGELKGGARIESVLYEAMGPGGAAMLISCATDNTNRTVSEVKTVLKKNAGKFVSGGGVQFQFDHRGQIIVETDSPDEAELAAIDAGAEDVTTESEDGKTAVIVTTTVVDLRTVREAMEKAGFDVTDTRLTYLPKQPLVLAEENRPAYEQLCDALEELDDVQEIYTNVVESL